MRKNAKSVFFRELEQVEGCISEYESLWKQWEKQRDEESKYFEEISKPGALNLEMDIPQNLLQERINPCIAEKSIVEDMKAVQSLHKQTLPDEMCVDEETEWKCLWPDTAPVIRKQTNAMKKLQKDFAFSCNELNTSRAEYLGEGVEQKNQFRK